jgi:hypothetical protein
MITDYGLGTFYLKLMEKEVLIFVKSLLAYFILDFVSLIGSILFVRILNILFISCLFQVGKIHFVCYCLEIMGHFQV